MFDVIGSAVISISDAIAGFQNLQHSPFGVQGMLISVIFILERQRKFK